MTGPGTRWVCGYVCGRSRHCNDHCTHTVTLAMGPSKGSLKVVGKSALNGGVAEETFFTTTRMTCSRLGHVSQPEPVWCSIIITKSVHDRAMKPTRPRCRCRRRHSTRALSSLELCLHFELSRSGLRFEWIYHNKWSIDRGFHVCRQKRLHGLRRSKWTPRSCLTDCFNASKRPQYRNLFVHEAAVAGTFWNNKSHARQQFKLSSCARIKPGNDK